MLTVFFRLFFGYYRRHYNTPKKSEFIHIRLSVLSHPNEQNFISNRNVFSQLLFFAVVCITRVFSGRKITEKRRRNFLLHNRGIINTFFWKNSNVFRFCFWNNKNTPILTLSTWLCLFWDVWIVMIKAINLFSWFFLDFLFSFFA